MTARYLLTVTDEAAREQAKAAGLVDDIGYLDDAVEEEDKRLKERTEFWADDTREKELLNAVFEKTFGEMTFVDVGGPKLDAWNRNKENSRAWLALNMMTEARAGFRAFNEGTKQSREVDFVALRQALARGQGWDEAFTDSLMPGRRA